MVADPERSVLLTVFVGGSGEWEAPRVVVVEL